MRVGLGFFFCLVVGVMMRWGVWRGLVVYYTYMWYFTSMWMVMYCMYVCMYVCIVGGWIYSNGDIRPWKRHATYIQVQDSSHLTKINDTTSSQTHTCRHTHIHIHTRSPPSPPLLPSLPPSLLPTRTSLPLRSARSPRPPLPSPPLPSLARSPPPCPNGPDLTPSVHAHYTHAHPSMYTCNAHAEPRRLAPTPPGPRAQPHLSFISAHAGSGKRKGGLGSGKQVWT